MKTILNAASVIALAAILALWAYWIVQMSLS